MFIRWSVALSAVVLSLIPVTYPQAIPAKPDYSQEASVIEEMSTEIVFDNDGGSTRVQSSRIRVQSDGGVQNWGLLKFPFQSATQTVDVDYVRVHKPDGSILPTPPDNIQDLDSEITRSAPFYSDLREKHVAVKGLGKGDVLEYEAHWKSTKPLIPGQFWFQYSFQQEGIVLRESLEVKVPEGRAVKFKGPQAAPTITSEAGSRVYTWTGSRLQSAKDAGSELKKQAQAVLGRFPPPDVQISSFQNWEDVGRWYWGLQKDRIQPTDAIRAKAAKLTKGLTDDAAKAQAIYNFVSLQYRYIGISFGIGRYQPHAAEDVLANNYGDCKDKFTLLASLLQASGIMVYPALINSTWKLDPDVPSPAQFDHVIGYLPQAKEAVWLDTTPEVAPFGYLVPRLRDKPALVMLADKSVQLITTPADPPFASSQNFKISGKLSDDGTLDAQVEDTIKGDREIIVRSAFRQIPPSQWKNLVQQISYTLGYSGSVSDVTASAPEVMSEVFHFAYSYNRKDYPDWGNHQFTVPGLPFFMPQLKDDANEALWLGSPDETISDSRMQLPKGYKPRLPSNVDLKYDFAEYHASYSQDQGVLIARRRLVTKLHELPAAEFDDYRTFVKNLQNDINQFVQVSWSSAAGDSATNMHDLLREVRELPDSNSSEANRIEAEIRGSNMGSAWAIDALTRAVAADPKFIRAWLELSAAYGATGQIDSSLDAMRRAIDSDPKLLLTRKIYASSLAGIGHAEAAMDAWREALKIAPDDAQSNSGMGQSLLQQKRANDAIPYLENAAKGDPAPAAQFRLGLACLSGGQIERGVEILEKVALTGPEMLNDVAYELADAKVGLEKALEFAQRAVAQQEKESSEVKLADLVSADLNRTLKLGYYWDTLGWAYFRLGRFDEAESYLRAAWLLTQMGDVADHLGQVYEQEKKTADAIHMYRLAASTMGNHSGVAGEGTRHRLENLPGEKPLPKFDPYHPATSGAELSELRSAKIKRLVPGSAAAEFFLLFSPGPKIEETKFISGSDKLQSAGPALAQARFQIGFPRGSSARLVRRAILSCSAVTGCAAVLFPPETVKSVH